MRQLKGFKTSVVGVAVVTAPAAMLVFGAGTAGAAPPTPSPGHSTKEPIDQSRTETVTALPPVRMERATARAPLSSISRDQVGRTHQRRRTHRTR